MDLQDAIQKIEKLEKQLQDKEEELIQMTLVADEWKQKFVNGRIAESELVRKTKPEERIYAVPRGAYNYNGGFKRGVATSFDEMKKMTSGEIVWNVHCKRMSTVTEAKDYIHQIEHILNGCQNYSQRTARIYGSISCRVMPVTFMSIGAGVAVSNSNIAKLLRG